MRRPPRGQRRLHRSRWRSSTSLGQQSSFLFNERPYFIKHNRDVRCRFSTFGKKVDVDKEGSGGDPHAGIPPTAPQEPISSGGIISPRAAGAGGANHRRGSVRGDQTVAGGNSYQHDSDRTRVYFQFREFHAIDPSASPWIVQTLQLIGSHGPVGRVFCRAFVPKRSLPQLAMIIPRVVLRIARKTLDFGGEMAEGMSDLVAQASQHLDREEANQGALARGGAAHLYGYDTTWGDGAADGADGGGGGGTKAPSAVVNRMPLKAEEMLRVQNPDLFRFLIAKDPVEMGSAATVLIHVINYYRFTFTVRRTVKGVLGSMRMVQRFVRSRVLAQLRFWRLRVAREWGLLERQYLLRLMNYAPLPGDVVDASVNEVLQRTAITDLPSKLQLIVEHWEHEKRRWHLQYKHSGGAVSGRDAAQLWRSIDGKRLMEASLRRLSERLSHGPTSIFHHPALKAVFDGLSAARRDGGHSHPTSHAGGAHHHDRHGGAAEEDSASSGGGGGQHLESTGAHSSSTSSPPPTIGGGGASAFRESPTAGGASAVQVTASPPPSFATHGESKKGSTTGAQHVPSPPPSKPPHSGGGGHVALLLRGSVSDWNKHRKRR